MRSISIIGCGWFGFPLAQQLVKNGYQVKGSKTTQAAAQQLSNEDIEGFALCLPSSSPLPKALFASDILVINLPPGLRKGDSTYIHQLKQVLDAAKSHRYQHIIFVSSSGVYPDQGENIDENAPIGNSTKAQTLFAAERLIDENIHTEKLTIFRFAGLVGPSRHPGRFLAGKQNLSGAMSAVNLVHLHDIIQATLLALAHPKSTGTFNLCCDVHNSRQEFYTRAAEKLQLTSPQFNAENKPVRIINGQKIVNRLGFSYEYNNLEQLISM